MKLRRFAFKKTVFANGLTLVSERHPEFRSLSIGVWVRTGTRNEGSSEAGISHFIEHMLFKGTRERSSFDIAQQIDRVGGDFNAFTARDHTCFHLLLMDKDLKLGIDILSDILLNSSFESKEIERERKVILQEIAMGEDAPEELSEDLFMKKIFPRHGLGRPILGTHHSIQNLSRAQILRFFYRRYRPDQILISVAGNVTHESIRRRLKSLLKSWPGRKSQDRRKRWEFEKAPSMHAGAWWVRRKQEQAHLVWAMPAPRYRSRDRYAMTLLNIHLGGGMSSLLFRRIREQEGLVYSVFSTLMPFTDTGVFMIYTATSVSKILLCLKLIEDCVSEVQQELISEKALKMLKDNLKGSVLLSADNVESRMMSIAYSELFMRQNSTPSGICDEIDAVTVQDFRRVARKVLGSRRRSMLVLGDHPGQRIRKVFAVE